MTKTFKQIREGDVPKDHEYGPSSRKRPAGKRGYTSSDSARTTHLKTVKKWSKKKRRQGDKEFANEANWSISPAKQKEVNKFLAKSTGGSMHQDVNLVMKKFGLSKSKAQDMVFNWMSSWSPDKRLSAWGPKDMPEEVTKRPGFIRISFKSIDDRDKALKYFAKAEPNKLHPDYSWKKVGSAVIDVDVNTRMYNPVDVWKKHMKIDFNVDKITEETPANATGSAVAGTGDDSSTVLVKKRKELQKRLMRRFSIKETLDKILPDPVEKEDELTTRKKQLKELAKNRND